ncbi:E3 ubiquitin-protein ligase TRIM39-like isoform X2 [Carettochelys insculpta]|uniref:E3 ubiquitin-protein ligase TRIM39-like isoform X2 n=1 Tax=Carettochelys insculpta TaxID=44489 RepID=UPI003EB98AC6
MASTSTAGDIGNDAICSICLGYLTQPVTIACGHNYCQACLTRYCEERGPERRLPCPQCRAPFQTGEFKPNTQLHNIVEKLRELELKAGKGPKEGQCERHEERLKLFCEEDGEAICLVCEKSREHKSHSVVPIEEAAQEYKEKLQGALGPLRKQLAQALALTSEEEKKTAAWQDVRSALRRSESTKLQEPEAVWTDLKNTYRVCLDVTEALRRFAVDVTLDPDTAHPNLALSEDRKHVRFGARRQDLPHNPGRFENYINVLGAERLAGGRSYWEVEVGDKTGWDLGVCRESVSRNGESKLTPEDGYWAVWLRDGGYKACTSRPTPLPVSARPSRVGIFLDYEAGEVSFYNVTDRSHLFTFTHTFSGPLRPFFCPGVNPGGTNAAPLTICPLPAQPQGISVPGSDPAAQTDPSQH